MTIHPTTTKKYDELTVYVFPSANKTGHAMAVEAFEAIQQAIHDKGRANVILATGTSQLPFFEGLRAMHGVNWGKVNFFHMDEYIGLPAGHPASFPRFLRTHLLDHLTPPFGAFYPVPGGQVQPGQSYDDLTGPIEYEKLLKSHPADLCVMGIGRNGHLAFNDPPYANFNDPDWVKVIKLAELSRLQQVDEGHFASLDEVPTHAVTLTIPALLAAKRVLVIALGEGKAEIVRETLQGPITPELPASILRKTPRTRLFLDQPAASLVIPVPE